MQERGGSKMNGIYTNLNGVAFEVTKVLQNGIVELSRLGNDTKIYLTTDLIREHLVRRA
jgi:hypothetical protein